MSGRKLASVQKIISVEPIEGADKIESVRVLGWQCVTQKSNNFKPGDLCCYFEVDSLIPTNHPFDFLKKKPEDTVARLKTIRLRGQISQGLVLPFEQCFVNKENGMHALTDAARLDIGTQINGMLHAHGVHNTVVQEGADVTNFFGITEWTRETPVHLSGQKKGNFPYFLTKTDEPRLQGCPSVLERHVGEQMYITEKIDGSSMTVFYYPKEYFDHLPHSEEDDARGYAFGVCSREIWLSFSEDNSFCKVALKYDLENKLKNYNKPIALQGEIFGPGIQKNKLNRPTVEFNVFNAVDLDTKSYLGYNRMIETVVDLGLSTVPILATNVPLDHTVDQFVNMSINKSSINPDVWQEGIVVRPREESRDSKIGRFSFKVINPEFLLKYGE